MSACQDDPTSSERSDWSYIVHSDQSSPKRKEQFNQGLYFRNSISKVLTFRRILKTKINFSEVGIFTVNDKGAQIFRVQMTV